MAKKTRTGLKAAAPKTKTTKGALACSVVNPKDIALLASKRQSRYRETVETILGLKVGQAVTIPVPSDLTIEKLRMSLSVQLRRRLASAGFKHRVQIRTLADTSGLLVKVVE